MKNNVKDKDKYGPTCQSIFLLHDTLGLHLKQSMLLLCYTSRSELSSTRDPG